MNAMRLKGLLAAMLVLVPGVAGGQSDPPGNYRAFLSKLCPARHLEWLSEGEIDDLIEVNFHDALPSRLQSKFDAADRTEKVACANVTMGLSCFNAAYFRAMNDVDLLPRFAKMICASGFSCHGPVDCQKQ
jgi:hypothetical protein